MRAAIGLKARTGRAVFVTVAGDIAAPQLVARGQMPLLPEGVFAPYHAAEGLPPARAQASVDGSIAAARALAHAGIFDAVARAVKAGHDVVACGVLLGPGMPDWTTAQILAVHVRMHQAEGELFRNVLAAGSQACGLPTLELRERAALDDAAQALRITRGRLEAAIAALGKAAGPPWGKDQKEAAAAALAALGS